MYYYNQNDYSSISYAYKNNGKTVKTSGCGVCSACMVLNNLASTELYTVSKMAKFSLDNNARDAYGTNMITLLDALCKKHKEYKYSTTSDVSKLISHLKGGGVAIINQGDSYNVFSTSGHFVVAYKMSDDNIEILDPQMYNGKYDLYSRPKRIIKKTSHGCIVNKNELKKACADRNPAFYLVSYTKPKTSSKTTQKAKKVEDKTVYPYFTPNATVKANSKVFADNARTKEVGSVSKNERVKALVVGKTNTIIQYRVNDKTYKVGLIYSTNIIKDKN